MLGHKYSFRVQAHPQEFWFVKNTGKIPKTLGKIPKIWEKSVKKQEKSLNI